MGMFDMLGKLGEMKTKMEEMKKRLDTVYVNGEAGNGKIMIELSANRTVKKISIADELVHPDRKEELIDLLEIALGKALENANAVSEAEMKAAGKDLLPNIPGLF
ncbi:MAG: YbaB/EbfC family nucleoid-associated protein [Bacteroidetes bacterium]|nr:YbaB/EbfC family nucleoid-associated protein [Bacteroidota bacterium]